MKNKTLAVWLTFLLGALGLHRWYLLERYDALARLLPIPTLLGAYGVWRARSLGVDDLWSWLLIPMLGFTLAGCALNAIVYGLMAPEKWNQRFNAQAPVDAPAGATNWVTILGVGAALAVGTTVLMASIAFSFQRYFEYQMEDAQSLSQPAPLKKSAG
ncbi:hypothetical protein [Rhodoferax saidenbachensis]|uniref:TM2 domain-containing protein n=1 Tax=Rhodoferax saidenbachensis TaxID=1484693 RepID=A0ABU1ZLS7_9BURK|nr:hypothetical protein [Rhodoferax saidenbachensis]MDR7306474.1 hypothetical protein [Rhodoferax saidenbachensis]